jgi:hypothetical protein
MEEKMMWRGLGAHSMVILRKEGIEAMAFRNFEYDR